MATIVNVPVTVIPAFPSLDSISISNLVGPTAANRQPNQLDVRDDSLRTEVNNLIGAVNDIGEGGAGGTVLFLPRDGTDAMLGNLNMGSQKIIDLADASAATDGMNQQSSDARYVEEGGDTMTGLLVLSGDPVVALGAATRQYVDSGGVGIITPVQSRRLTIIPALVTAHIGTRAVMYDADVLGGATPTKSKEAILTGILTDGINTDGWNYIYLVGDTTNVEPTELVVSPNFSDAFTPGTGLDVFRLIGSVFQVSSAFLAARAAGEWCFYDTEILFDSLRTTERTVAVTELQSKTAVTARIRAEGRDGGGTNGAVCRIGAEGAVTGVLVFQVDADSTPHPFYEHGIVMIPLVPGNGNVKLFTTAGFTDGGSFFNAWTDAYQERL